MVIGIKYDGDDLECAIQFQQTDTSQLWRWRCWSRIHTIHWNSRSVCTISSFFTARQHTCSLLCRTPILAMTGSVRQTVCLTVRHTLVSCQKDSSYDHAVFMEDSPMTLVSSWLTAPQNSKGNIGNGTQNDTGIGKIQPVCRSIPDTVQDGTMVTVTD